MPDSLRQQLFDAVKARFALITSANGYATNVGSKLTAWHLHPKDAEDLPGVDLQDEAERTVIPNAGKNAGAYDRLLRITAIAEVLEPGADAPNTRKALADMIKAVGVDPKWGGLARRTIPVEDDVTVDDSNQRIGAARLVFDIEFARAPWQA